MSINFNVLCHPVVAGTILATLVGCASNGANYVPPEALTPPSQQLSDALLAFSSKTQSEVLVKYRRAAREDLMYTAVSDFFKGKDWSQSAFDEALPKPRELLCLPRYGHLRISAPVQNVSARATAVKSLLAPPSDDVKDLLKHLSKNYTVDITAVDAPPSYDEWIAGAGEPCAAAVRDADPFAMRNYIGKESLLAAITGGKVLFDSVWGIVKPAVVGSLQTADMERRNRAIQEFFSDANNVNALKRDIEHIEKFLKQEFEFDQKRTAGAAVVAQASAFTHKQFEAALAVAKKDNCPESIRRLNQVKTDPQGVACLRSVYEKFSGPITTALDAADTFDASIEKHLPKDTLSSQIDTLSDIAKGKMPVEDKARAFWATLVRYTALYNTVKSTGSDENQAKLKEALEAFQKALK